jgi:hypothetical protein
MFFKGKYPGGNLDASKEKGSKEKEALTSSEKMLATTLKSLTASREKHLTRGFLLPRKFKNGATSLTENQNCFKMPCAGSPLMLETPVKDLSLIPLLPSGPPRDELKQ